jgi:hypothetical protein
MATHTNRIGQISARRRNHKTRWPAWIATTARSRESGETGRLLRQIRYIEVSRFYQASLQLRLFGNSRRQSQPCAATGALIMCSGGSILERK